MLELIQILHTFFELKNLDSKTGPPFVHAMASALPSGKRLHNYGKSPFLMDTSL